MSAISHAARELASTPLPYFLGVALMFAAIKWDGHLRDPQRCFEIRDIRGTYYKVDTCTGRIEKMEPQPGATLPSTKVQPTDPKSQASGSEK